MCFLWKRPQSFSISFSVLQWWNGWHSSSRKKRFNGHKGKKNIKYTRMIKVCLSFSHQHSFSVQQSCLILSGLLIYLWIWGIPELSRGWRCSPGLCKEKVPPVSVRLSCGSSCSCSGAPLVYAWPGTMRTAPGCGQKGQQIKLTL